MKKKKVDYKRLPVSQKKNPFTGRVGKRANNIKRGHNVSLNDVERQPTKQPKLAHITNANSSAEAQVNINRSVNVNNSNGSNSNANQTVKASTPYTPNTTTCITSTANANTISSINTTSSTTSTANTCIILTVNATTNTNLAQQNKKDDEVEFVKTSHRSASKAGKFHLSEQDISTISTGDWLTDHIVGAAQSVLREQFPHARGLENTTLGPIFNFSVQKGQFSQILNTGSHHWVLVSTVGCYTPSVVYLYDSLFSGRIAALVQKQIASIIYEEGTSFKVIVPNVQHQNNDSCQSSIAVLIVGRRKLTLPQSGMAFSVSSIFSYFRFSIREILTESRRWAINHAY